MRTKILSILIPVYNQEDLVIKAINSVPERDDIEIIVVDDASTDKTVENLRKLSRPVTIITVEPWQTTGFCRNLALKRATGEFIFWLDSDDRLDTPKFEKFIEFLYKDTTDDVINIRLLDNNNKIYDGRKIWSTCTKVSRLDSVHKYNIAFPDIVIGEDKIFWNDFNSHKITVGFYNEIFYYYNHPRKYSAMWNHNHLGIY